MKVKINIKSYMLFPLMALAYIVQARWLNLLKISVDRSNLIVLIAIICLIIVKESIKKNTETKVALSFLVMVVYQICISSLLYEQSIGSSYRATKVYWTILLFFTLEVFAKNRKDVINIEKMLICISLASSFLMSMQVLIFEPIGIKLISLNYSSRFGNLRCVTNQEISAIGMILATACLFEKRKSVSEKIIYVCTLVFGWVELLFISKTKMWIMIVMIVMVIQFFFRNTKGERNIGLRRITTGILIAITLYFVFTSNIFNMYLNDFNEPGQYSSMETRKSEIQYAWKSLTSNPYNFIFGLGSIDQENLKYLYITLPQESTMGGVFFGRTDIGILGFMHEFGLIGVVWYIVVVIYGGKILLNARRKGYRALDLMAMYFCLILGSGTLFMINPERMEFFSIFLMLTFYYNHELKYNKTKGYANEAQIT